MQISPQEPEEQKGQKSDEPEDQGSESGSAGTQINSSSKVDLSSKTPKSPGKSMNRDDCISFEEFKLIMNQIV